MVMNEKEALEDKHLHAREFWHALTHPESGTHQYVNTLWKASRTPERCAAAARPSLGRRQRVRL